MNKLTFLGATGTVTGSRFFLDTQDKKFLIDCGLFQGLKKNRLRNWDPFPVSPASLDAVFLTHAHIDHSGFLPKIVKEGFNGKIYCTPATKDLVEVLLMDTAHIQEEDSRWANKKGFSRHSPALPLFTTADAKKTLPMLNSLFYGEDFFLNEKLRIKFKDAGHILGSAFMDIKIKDQIKDTRILFSGDLGRPDQPILRNPVQAFNVDHLIMESTYGNRLHDQGDPKEELARVITESYERGGLLMIPSFAVGRTQTVLYMLCELEREKRIPVMDVYLDSPMAIDATRIFQAHKSDYDFSARIHEIRHENIMKPERLKICKHRDDSRKINQVKDKAILISASGMLSGGRILHHLIQRLPRPEDTLLFIGYQAEGTRGRTILNGNKEVKIHGQQVPVNCHIENMTGLSAHADYNEMLAWLMGFNRPPKMTYLVHGNPDASKALKQKIEKHLRWKVCIPEFNESFNID